jgi:hypothetical protein
MQRLKVEAEITIFLLFFEPRCSTRFGITNGRWQRSTLSSVSCSLFSGRNKQAAGK